MSLVFHPSLFASAARALRGCLAAPVLQAGGMLCCWVAFHAVALAQTGGTPAEAAPREQAQTRTAAPQELPRPRIGLVLSGGGARGLAHVGVLQTLRELRVPVDLVVGTSMGALVGGAYAAGRSVEDLDALVRQADWSSILAERSPRSDMSFSRREEDRVLASRVELGLTRSGLLLPPSAAANSGLEIALDRLAPGAVGLQTLRQLPVPFEALATDLVNGRMVSLSDVPLTLAMRASMAVPGLFSPVRVQGRLVVDGGLVRNLGVDVARQMGADIIIAVNVGSPLLDEQEIQGALSVTDQMVRILTTQNVENSLAELRPEDILIDPELAGVGLTDFARSAEIVHGGQQASMAVRDRLKALSLSAKDYAAHEAWRQRSTAALSDHVPLAKLSITGTRRTHAEALKNELPVREGESVSLAQLQEAKAQLYGRGDFDRVDVQMRDVNGQREAELQVSEADWARSRLRLGFEVASDFNSESRYTLSGVHTITWLNRWGAELRTVAKIGWAQELGFTLNQPLGAGSAWYVEPAVRYSGYKVQAVLEDVKFSASEYSLAVGRRLGRWGDLQLATTRFRGENRMTFRLKDSKFLSQWSGFREQQQQDTQELRWRVDTLDAPAFPEEGYLINATTALTWVDGQAKQSRQTVLKATALKAFRLGGWAGHVYVDAMQGTENHPISADVGLGRFLRMSGSTAPAGSNVLSYSFGRLVMAKRLGQMPVGLGGAVRAGVSLEVGHEEPTPGANVLIDTGSITRARTRWANSAFVAIDTRFGPVYWGVGKTLKGDSSFYFFVGPVW